MKQPFEFEQSAQRSFEDIKRSCQTLLSRIRALAKMTEEVDPMSPQSSRARSAMHFLEYAMDSLVPKEGIKLDFAGAPRSTVTHCVDHLIEGLSDPAGGRPFYKEGPKPGLVGTAKAVALPEILSFLSAHQKSGVLEIVALSETVVIGLKRGEIIHATSDGTPAGLRLGEVLVAQGAVDERALYAALGKSSRDGRNNGKLGEILEKELGVPREKLREALEFQIQHLFQRLHTQQDASFSFYEREPSSVDTLVRLNVNRLLLEAACRADNGVVESLPPRGAEAGGDEHRAA